jgi:sortase A
VVYQVYYTPLQSEIATQNLAREFKSKVLTSNQEVSVSPETKAANFRPATVLGLLYIPKLKSDVWGEPIVYGTGYSELAQGIGYYPNNALPSEDGNFAIAGHRVTYSQPFYYFEKLAAGDEVFVLMEEGWYSYELLADKKIQESEVWVLDNIQPQLGLSGEERLITLTTCDPRWNSTQRWAWWGVQTGFYPLDQTPAAIGEDF